MLHSFVLYKCTSCIVKKEQSIFTNTNAHFFFYFYFLTQFHISFLRKYCEHYSEPITDYLFMEYISIESNRIWFSMNGCSWKFYCGCRLPELKFYCYTFCESIFLKWLQSFFPIFIDYKEVAEEKSLSYNFYNGCAVIIFSGQFLYFFLSHTSWHCQHYIGNVF